MNIDSRPARRVDLREEYYLDTSGDFADCGAHYGELYSVNILRTGLGEDRLRSIR